MDVCLTSFPAPLREKGTAEDWGPGESAEQVVPTYRGKDLVCWHWVGNKDVRLELECVEECFGRLVAGSCVGSGCKVGFLSSEGIHYY